MSDPDDISVSIAYGYAITWAEIEEIYAAAPPRPTAHPGDLDFHFRGKTYEAPEELIEVWCQEYGWAWMQHADFNHCAPRDVVFHISPSELMGKEELTVEELMRMETAACDIGFKLMALGFKIEGPPKVTYSAAIFR